MDEIVLIDIATAPEYLNGWLADILDELEEHRIVATSAAKLAREVYKACLN